MKHFLLFAIVLFLMNIPAISQEEVAPVVALDDSLPVLGSVMLDPSNQPVTFRTLAGDELFTELGLSSSGALRAPVSGTPHVFAWSSSADLRKTSVSGGSGLFKNLPLEVTVSITPVAGGGTVQTFDTEMLAMSISGGAVLPGFMIRESPTRASTGRLLIRESPTYPSRNLVQSFFDVFTELSLDGGATWTPADGPIRIEAKIKPTVLINRPDPPVPYPAGRLIGDLDCDGREDLVLTNEFASLQPLGGETIIHSSSCDAQYRYDGLDRLVKNAPYSVRVTHTFDDGDYRYFDTEMLQLDLAGGTLPSGIHLRESPTRASVGRTSIRALPTGQFEFSSFFDIFTELSIDGGQSWTPQSPSSLEYKDTLKTASGATTSCASVATYPSDLYPFAGISVSKPTSPDIAYSNGMRAKGIVGKKPGGGSTARALPSLGQTDVYTQDEDCDGLIDDNSGAGFIDFHTAGSSVVRITHTLDDGDVRVFDTEMLALNLVGNQNGQVLMIRESPTRASLGRTTVAPNGSGFRIDSFFDIFTEISLDGGQNWFPSADSIRLEQELLPEEREFATTNFPPPGVLRMSPACAELEFENGARLGASSFFDIFTEVALPPMGGTGGASSAPYAATGRSMQSVSLDGGNSFFDVFTEAAMMLQVTPMDSTPDGNYYDTEMLSLNLSFPGGIMVRESPTKASLGRITLRESPTLPSKGRISSFFDIFTEISLDGGQTWSSATSSMRVELDSVANGSISGVKWHDANGNGINDGEAGLGDWNIVLADTLGNVIDSIRTDPSGNYSFTDVPSGTYRVIEEPQSGWLQTGGSPVYGFMTAPDQDVTGIDFGNFNSPNLTGHKFNDRNNNGLRDENEEGLPGWKITLSPDQIPTPGTSISSGTGSITMHLNGLPPGEPVISSLSAFAVTRKGWDGTIKGSSFENGQIPVQLVALDFLSIDPVVIGGSSYKVKALGANGEGKKEYVGHVTLLKARNRITQPFAGTQLHSSFFDVFVDLDLVPRLPVGSAPFTPGHLSCQIILEAALSPDGEPDPLMPGMRYRGGPVDILDENGLVAGTLDSLIFVVGQSASSANPIFTETDNEGQYSFSPMLPGSWIVAEEPQPGWVATTWPPNPCLVTSGAADLMIDFGNFRLSDTLKYRTFTYEQLRDASQEKPRKVPSVKIPNSKLPWYAPNTANLIHQILKEDLGFLQVGQPGKFYPWGKPAPFLRPMKQSEVFKTFNDKRTPFHFDPPGSPQPLNLNNNGKIISGWKKSIPPKDKNDVLIAELLTLQVNLEASDKGHTTNGLGGLIYTWPGPWGKDITIDSLASFGDKIMTNGIVGMIYPAPVNPTDYDSLYNAVRRINLAFASPVIDDTTSDGGWRSVPMKFKWKGASAVSEVPFVTVLSGMRPVVRSTPATEQFPTVFSLSQNYPNPFNPTTTINFDLPEQAMVTLKMYNMLGQEIATLIDNEPMEAGGQDILFNAGNISSGVYFYRISAQEIVDEDDGSAGRSFVSVRKMILLK